MSRQTSLDIDLTAFILNGVPYHKGGTLEQDAQRSAVLARFTVLGYKGGSTAKWVPLTDIDALDGSNKPTGIYVGPVITAAAIVEGDVTLDPDSVIVGGMGCVVDKNKVVLENSLTLATDIDYIDTGGSNGSLGTIEQLLRNIGIFMGDIVNTDGFENT
jgi:hypothetical protein